MPSSQEYEATLIGNFIYPADVNKFRHVSIHSIVKFSNYHTIGIVRQCEFEFFSFAQLRIHNGILATFVQMYSSNLKVDCDFRTIELLHMSISLKMCYVIITCNEVF